MSLTLEIPAELQRQLERAATARGTDVQTWLVNAARRELQAEMPTDENEKRKQAIDARFGFLRGRIGSSDEFLAERHAQARPSARKMSAP